MADAHHIAVDVERGFYIFHVSLPVYPHVADIGEQCEIDPVGRRIFLVVAHEFQ